MAGFGRAGPNQRNHPGLGIRFQLGPAKNDHDASDGPQADGQPDHDALDDAAAHSRVFFQLPQRTSLVLDRFKYRGGWYPVLYYRMAAPIPIVPQSGTGR